MCGDPPSQTREGSIKKDKELVGWQMGDDVVLKGVIWTCTYQSLPKNV